MNTKEQLTEIMINHINGRITYSEAKEKAMPIINSFNLNSTKLATKAKKRPMLISFEQMFGKEPKKQYA